MQIADSYDKPYHPIRDYLNGLRWDGRERLAGLLARYAGAEDTEINRTLSERFAISCVARVMKPGAKVDTVLILAGRQGLGKSTFFRALAGEQWFRDTALDIRNKDAFLALRGAWLYEMAELASMRARDAETVKAFLSATVDHYRKPYARNMVAQPRQCVFVGSTNEPSFLRDPTGAPDVAAVERDRDQLWAEALALYQQGRIWWLESDAALEDSHERYQHEDPWESAIRDWLAGGSDRFTVTDVLTEAIRMDLDKQAKHHEMRVGGILARLGYEKRRVRVGGARAYRWSRPSLTTEDP
jgi:predicted P-loop ATPase